MWDQIFLEAGTVFIRNEYMYKKIRSLMQVTKIWILSNNMHTKKLINKLLLFLALPVW